MCQVCPCFCHPVPLCPCQPQVKVRLANLRHHPSSLNIVRDSEAVDGVEHVIRAGGKAFDLGGDFSVVDRLDLDLAVVVGITLTGGDLVLVNC